MEIPTFEDARKRILEDESWTPLDRFVYLHEPADKEKEKEFRETLKELIDFIIICSGE